MPEKPLPSLPYGMGSYSYHTLRSGAKDICYQKNIGDPGNRKRVTVYGATVGECNEKMRLKEREYEEKARVARHSDPRNAGLPLKTAVHNWLVNFKRQEAKSRYYDTLESTFDVHLSTADFANKQVEQVTDVDIQTWLNGIAEKRSSSTVKKCYHLVSMFFAYYYVRRPNDNPMLTVSKARDEKTKKVEVDEDGSPVRMTEEDIILDDGEIERFTREALRVYATGRPAHKYGPMMCFAVWTFMRYGEMTALTWRDVDMERGLAVVNKNQQRVVRRDADGSRVTEGNRTVSVIETPKTLSSDRPVVLCREAVKALETHRERNCPGAGPDDLIFATDGGKPVSDEYVNDVMASVLKGAGIEKHVTFHDLRHTGISYFLRHGIDPMVVQRMAGHSSVNTTNDIYYSLTEEQVRKEFEKLGGGDGAP